MSRWWAVVLSNLLLAVTLALPVAAQDAIHNKEPYASWGRTAERAERLIDEGAASDAQLETVRAMLAEQRDAAFQITQESSVEARTLRAQLNSLGAPPAEGETESEEIAARRAALRQALAEANAPILAAQEAYERANLLVSELDAMIRAQMTRELLIRNPAPVMPHRWLTTLEELGDYGRRLQQEVGEILDTPAMQERLPRALPTSLVLLVVALLLWFVVQPVVARRLEQLMTRAERRLHRWLFSGLAGLSRLIIATLAAAAAVLAIRVLAITPASASTLLTVVPVMAMFIVLAHWLGYLLFKPNHPDQRPLSLDDDSARHGLHLSQGLGLFIAIELVLQSLEKDYPFTPVAVAVLSTPVTLFGSLLIWRLAGLLGQRHQDDDEAVAEGNTQAAPSEEEPSPNAGVLRLLARLLQISAVLGVFFVIAGYDNLARRALNPMIISIGLIGFVMVLYHVIIRSLEDALGREADTHGEGFGLIPIGIVFLLSLALAPLLALIWGARATDIAEIWRLLTEGVALGDTRISLEVLITLIVVFFMGLLVTRWLQRLLRVTVLPRTRMDLGARTALITGVGYVGLTLAALTAVSTAGLNLASLAVVAGALSVGIGFGLQTIVSNFVSGIILLIERPIKEGDWIEVSGFSGYVRKISVRSTRIETFDRHDVIVPNSELIAGIVKNMTLTSNSGRLVLPVGVAYGSNLERTRAILLEAARVQPQVLAYPAPVVLFMGLGESSLDFELRCYLRNVGDLLTVRSDLLFAIYGALEKDGIDIPFPQRDIHVQGIDRLVDALEGRQAKPHAMSPRQGRA